MLGSKTPPKHNKMLLRETLRALVLFPVLRAAQNIPSPAISLGRRGPSRGGISFYSNESFLGKEKERLQNATGMPGLFPI